MITILIHFNDKGQLIKYVRGEGTYCLVSPSTHPSSCTLLSTYDGLQVADVNVPQISHLWMDTTIDAATWIPLKVWL